MTTPIKWGSEIPVNTTTVSTQDQPSITALASGWLVAVWRDISQTGGDTSSQAVRGPCRHRQGMAVSMHRTMLARVRRWLDERRARRELLILSDVALKDLAMDRSEIVSVVHHGQSDRTRHRTKW